MEQVNEEFNYFAELNYTLANLKILIWNKTNLDHKNLSDIYEISYKGENGKVKIKIRNKLTRSIHQKIKIIHPEIRILTKQTNLQIFPSLFLLRIGLDKNYFESANELQQAFKESNLLMEKLLSENYSLEFTHIKCKICEEIIIYIKREGIIEDQREFVDKQFLIVNQPNEGWEERVGEWSCEGEIGSAIEAQLYCKVNMCISGNGVIYMNYLNINESNIKIQENNKFFETYPIVCKKCLNICGSTKTLDDIQEISLFKSEIKFYNEQKAPFAFSGLQILNDIIGRHYFSSSKDSPDLLLISYIPIEENKTPIYIVKYLHLKIVNEETDIWTNCIQNDDYHEDQMKGTPANLYKFWKLLFVEKECSNILLASLIQNTQYVFIHENTYADCYKLLSCIESEVINILNMPPGILEVGKNNWKCSYIKIKLA